MPTPRTARSATLLLIAATAAACSDVAGPDAARTSTPPTARAALAATTQSITLVSGGGAVGTLDPNTEFSMTRGSAYASAPIVAGAGGYSTIPGTRWVSNSPTSIGPENGSVWYRTSFTLPAGCSDPRSPCRSMPTTRPRST